jgi:hypothetical protein
MNPDLALKVLSQIMSWGDERARKEFAWLRLMSRLKYDGYRDFQAGMRFVESLSVWLQQFESTERETAYKFVRETLTYIGPAELQRLVEQFYPRTVRARLNRIVAGELGIPLYRVLIDEVGRKAYDTLRRKTLFMGLSDGARIDIVRHSNVGLLTNEQLIIASQVDPDKWKDLLDSLREDLKDNTARFKMIYLIDDFAGTGTSFFRYSDKKKKWTGKLVRFRDSLEKAYTEFPDLLADDWELCIHHYIGSTAAQEAIAERLKKAEAELAADWWAKAINSSFGTVLSTDFPLAAGRDAPFIALTQKYYDPIIRTKHTDVGGATHMGLGYGACALPLVLEHNTPNNSVALLWAETNGGNRDGMPQPAPAMRPLFRRRQRHS